MTSANAPTIDVVVRPSGVWNTRAPFHSFLISHRNHHRLYGILTLAALRTQLESTRLPNSVRNPKRFLLVRDLPGAAIDAWKSFNLSVARPGKDSHHHLTLDDVRIALDDAVYFIRESSIVSYVSDFETYIHCWALNFLLAKLEQGVAWSKHDRAVARAMSPLTRARPIKPTWPWVLEELKSSSEALARLLSTTYVEPIDEIADRTPVQLLVDILTFWRDYRNLIVHSGGIVSRGFMTRHGPVYEQIRRPHSQFMPPLEPSRPIRLYDTIFPALARAHYRFARDLDGILQDIAGDSRGHPHAPRPRVKGQIDAEQATPGPMLQDGDHTESLEWARNVPKVLQVQSAEQASEE